jgi:hypothetical protein
MTPSPACLLQLLVSRANQQAWDDSTALRYTVDAHLGKCWLARTRSWALSPPLANKTALPPLTHDGALPHWRNCISGSSWKRESLARLVARAYSECDQMRVFIDVCN